MGKGSAERPVKDRQAWRDNWDRIFREAQGVEDGSENTKPTNEDETSNGVRSRD